MEHHDRMSWCFSLSLHVIIARFAAPRVASSEEPELSGLSLPVPACPCLSLGPGLGLGLGFGFGSGFGFGFGRVDRQYGYDSLSMVGCSVVPLYGRKTNFVRVRTCAALILL